MTDSLFDDQAYTVERPPSEAEGLSADRRRTLKRAELLGKGIHPASKLPLLNNNETCRTCVHSHKSGGGRRDYWKCDLMPVTRGPGSDIRVSWPACSKWEPQ